MTLKAVPREDDHHRSKQEEFARKRAQGGFDVLFFGDSLTRRWEDYPDLWEFYFSSLRPLNFGVGADTLENMHYRVAAGNLDGLELKALCFLGGTNNLGEDPQERVLEKIAELLGAMEKRLAGVSFLVSGLYPRAADERGLDYNRMIAYINDGLRVLCAQRGYAYFDPAPLMRDPQGRFRVGLQNDGLHLNAEGYRCIGPALRRELEALLSGGAPRA